MIGECSICNKKKDLRGGGCFNCAEIQSILIEGVDMYDQSFLDKKFTLNNVKQVNAIINALYKSGKLK
jgi:hypothetical protein